MNGAKQLILWTTLCLTLALYLTLYVFDDPLPGNFTYLTTLYPRTVRIALLPLYSTLTNWEASELLVLAKHRSTFGKDKVIGIAVVPCSSLNDQDNHTLSLGSSSVFTDMGQAILNVLSARTFLDEFAKEFVALKMSQRSTASEDGGSEEHQEQQSSNGGGDSKATKSSRGGGLLSGLLK